MPLTQPAPSVVEPIPLSIVNIRGARLIQETPEVGWTRNKNKKSEFDSRTYPDVMIDLETLGTESNCQVLSIGAVRFRLDTVDDFDTILDPDRNFYARMDERDQAALGRTADEGTMQWWSEQSADARSVFDEEREDTKSVLKRWVKFCKGAKRIWGNGNMFDNAIMKSLCQDYGVKYPVFYSKDLDVRTLTFLWNSLTNWVSKGKRPTIHLGEEHNALDDARRQVLQCQLMYKDIRGSKYGPESAG